MNPSFLIAYSFTKKNRSTQIESPWPRNEKSTHRFHIPIIAHSIVSKNIGLARNFRGLAHSRNVDIVRLIGLTSAHSRTPRISARLRVQYRAYPRKRTPSTQSLTFAHTHTRHIHIYRSRSYSTAYIMHECEWYDIIVEMDKFSFFFTTKESRDVRV